MCSKKRPLNFEWYRKVIIIHTLDASPSFWSHSSGLKTVVDSTLEQTRLLHHHFHSWRLNFCSEEKEDPWYQSPCTNQNMSTFGLLHQGLQDNLNLALLEEALKEHPGSFCTWKGVLSHTFSSHSNLFQLLSNYDSS